MKKTFKLLAVGLLVSGLLFNSSCSKDKEAEELSQKIQNIIPEETVKELEAKGLKINRGNKPPIVEGIFEVSPFELSVPYGPEDSFQKGQIINSYRYKFYDQKNEEIIIDYKQFGTNDQGNGMGSFISGNGKKFSIFTELKGNTGNVSYTHVTIISGEITEDGIKDFQYGFIMADKKDDDRNNYMEIGQSRIWIDGDFITEKVDKLKSINQSQSGNNSSVLSIN